MAYATLGDLRGELLARLGMAAQGSGGTSQTLLNSFLRNGQHQLYWAQDWKHLTWYADKPLGVGQNLVDFPTACERDRRILKVETVQGGQWIKLLEGIRTEDWSLMDAASFPIRFERFAQALIYPKADSIYTVRFWYVSDLGRFTQDSDVATMDDQMILLHALANAKAHYRHPDAAQYQGQLADLLSSIRGQAFVSQGVVRRETGMEPERRPLVVGRDV